MPHNREFRWTASTVAKSSNVDASSSNLERTAKLLKSTYLINKCVEKFQDLSLNQLKKLVNVVHAEIDQDQELINDFFENAVNVDLMRQNLLITEDENTTNNAVNTITEWLMEIRKKKGIENLFDDDDLEKSQLNCTNYLNQSLDLIRNKLLKKFKNYKSKNRKCSDKSDDEEIATSNNEENIDSDEDLCPENIQINSTKIDNAVTCQKQNQFFVNDKEIFHQNSESDNEEQPIIGQKSFSDSDVKKTDDSENTSLQKVEQNDSQKPKNTNIKIITNYAVNEKFKIIKDNSRVLRSKETVPDAAYEQTMSNTNSPVVEKNNMFDKSKIMNDTSSNCLELTKKFNESHKKNLPSDETLIKNNSDCENLTIEQSEIKIMNSFTLDDVKEDSTVESECNKSENLEGIIEDSDNLPQNGREVTPKKRKKKKRKNKDTEHSDVENTQVQKEEIEFFDCGNTMTDVILSPTTKESLIYNSEEDVILDSQPKVKNVKKRVRNIQVEETNISKDQENISFENIENNAGLSISSKNVSDSASISKSNHFNKDIEDSEKSETEQDESQMMEDQNINDDKILVDESADEKSLVEEFDDDLENKEDQNSKIQNSRELGNFNFEGCAESKIVSDENIFLEAEEGPDEIPNANTGEIDKEKRHQVEENNGVLVSEIAGGYLEDDISIKDEGYFMGESEEYTSRRVSQLKRINLFDSDDSLSADEIESSQVPVQRKQIFVPRESTVNVDHETKLDNKKKNLDEIAEDSSDNDSMKEIVPKKVEVEKINSCTGNGIEFRIRESTKSNDIEEPNNRLEKVSLPDQIEPSKLCDGVNLESSDIEKPNGRSQEIFSPNHIKSPEILTRETMKTSDIEEFYDLEEPNDQPKKVLPPNQIESPKSRSRESTQTNDIEEFYDLEEPNAQPQEESLPNRIESSKKQEDTVATKKITEISELVECEDWVKQENDSTLLLRELQNDDLEVFVLEIPRIAFQGVDLREKKFELSRDVLKLGNMTFRALIKKGPTTTCVLKHKKKKFKTVNLHPKKYVIANSTIVSSNSSTSESHENSKPKKSKKQRLNKTKETQIDNNEIICNGNSSTDDHVNNFFYRSKTNKIHEIDPKLKPPQTSNNRNENNSSQSREEVIQEIAYNDLVCNQETGMKSDEEKFELNIEETPANKGKKTLNENDDQEMDERSAKRIKGMKRLDLFASDESDKDDKSNSENEDIFNSPNTRSQPSNCKKSSKALEEKKIAPVEIIKPKKKKRKLYFEE